MLAIKADRLKEDTVLQTRVVNKINKGKKVTFKYDLEEDKIAFLEQSCKLATEAGFAVGSAIGGNIGTAVGSFFGGSIGGSIGRAIGENIGGAIGAFIGRIGAWLANFLWKNVINKNVLYFKEAFSWFGLRPNRVIARTC